MEEIYASREPRNLLGFEIRNREGSGLPARFSSMRLGQMGVRSNATDAISSPLTASIPAAPAIVL